MANIVISGINGFIGSALREHFENQKHTVIGIPRKLLYSREDLIHFFLQHVPEYIIHTASYGNMAQHDDLDMIITANIACTWNLLMATKSFRYKGFINFGSSSEYGKQSVPMTTSMLPEADSFYGATKIAGTYLARATAKQFNLPIITVRPFSVYGPGEAKYRFIPQVVQNLKNYQPMQVDINANHDWIYIDDVVSAIDVLLKKSATFDGDIYNIGTGRAYNNLEIINTLEDISRRTLKIKTRSNMRPNDSQVWLDGSNRLRKLGWKPQISLYEGLKNCYDYYE